MRKQFYSLILVMTFLGFENNYAFDHSHSSFQKVLDQYIVQNGSQTLIKYQKLKISPSGLNQYLAQLTAVKKTEFDSWSKSQQLSILINAYNAWTIKLIMDNYPVDSIKDIGTFFTSPWKKKFFKWLGQDSYLDYLEHGKLEKTIKSRGFILHLFVHQLVAHHFHQKCFFRSH